MVYRPVIVRCRTESDFKGTVLSHYTIWQNEESSKETSSNLIISHIPGRIFLLSSHRSRMEPKASWIPSKRSATELYFLLFFFKGSLMGKYPKCALNASWSREMQVLT